MYDAPNEIPKLTLFCYSLTHSYQASSKISTSDFHGGKWALDTGIVGTSFIFWKKKIDLLSVLLKISVISFF